MVKEIVKTTDLSLLESFVSGIEGTFTSDNLRLKSTANTREIYCEGLILATLEYEGKVLVARMDPCFLFFPELENMLLNLGFFRLKGASKLVLYSSYVRKNYRAQYTFPEYLWKAWILNLKLAERRKKLFFLYKEEWVEIGEIVFEESNYIIRLVGEEKVKCGQERKVLWSDVKAPTSINYWSKSVGKFIVVPLFQSTQIPSILEIEKDGMIPIDDFWRIVRILNKTIGTHESASLMLGKKYEALKAAHIALKSQQASSSAEITALKATVIQRDTKIVLCLNSIDTYKKVIDNINL